MKNKQFFIIQSKKELDFFLSKIKFKNFIPVIWYPEITTYKNSNFIYISDLEKIKKKPVDIYLMKKFYTLLNKIDLELLKYVKDIPKINYFLNSGHSFKNLIDVYLNEINKLDILIKKSHKIGFFYKKTNNSLNFVQLIIDNYDQKKKKVFIKHNFTSKNSKYFFEKHHINLVNFLDKDDLSLRNIYNISSFFIKNIFKNENNKTKILTHMFDRYDDNFFSKKNFKNFEFIKYESIFYKYVEKKIKKNEKKNFFQKLYNNKKINFDFLEEKSINHKNILLKIILMNFEKIINIVIYNYNKSLHLSKLYKFKSIIHKYETLSSVTVTDSMTDKNIKSFFLSHGGTVGIFENWPPVTSYFTLKNKNTTYLTFSKKIKEYILKVGKKIKNNINVDFVPNHNHLVFLKKSDPPKKIFKIAYFFSPTYGVYESKVGLHHDIELDFFRRRLFTFIKNKKNLNVNCKLYNINSIPKNIINLIKKIDNIKIIPEKKALFKIFDENDLIVTEVNSTTLVEAQYSNKFVLSLVKSFPKIKLDAEKKLSKRVFLVSDEKSFYKKIQELLNKKFHSKKIISNRDFLRIYYSYNHLNKNFIIKKFKKILN